MDQDLKNRRTIEAMIRTQLIELIRLGARHGIRIEALMNEALEFCGAEPPFCN